MSGACQGQYLGHVWGIIWGISGATIDNNGQQWTRICGATCICDAVFKYYYYRYLWTRAISAMLLRNFNSISCYLSEPDTSSDISGWMSGEYSFVLGPKSHADYVSDFRKASSNNRWNHSPKISVSSSTHLQINLAPFYQTSK